VVDVGGERLAPGSAPRDSLEPAEQRLAGQKRFDGESRIEGPRGVDARRHLGRLRLWVPLFLIFWACVWAIDGLTRDVFASGYTTLDPRRSRLDVRTGFVDPRWERWMAERLAGLSEISSLDDDGVRGMAATVAALPFVAEIGEPRVRWPDGFELPVRLRQPAACIRSGEEYLAVSSEGVVLPGAWPTPPWIDPGFLPVIGPNDHAFDRARPGDVLREARHLDALSVAVSMRGALTKEDFEAMGPPLIDASRARQASPSEPGIVLELEHRREVYFGRPPWTREPGELPCARKWASLSRALRRLVGPDPRDWSVLDVRWDAAGIQERAAPGG
jgi:hypothetical protein